MSLASARAPCQIAMCPLNDACLMRRFSVKPGLTCLWQVNGRSNTSFEQWIALDLQYIDTWSLGLDAAIIAKTIPAVFRGRGAV